MTRCSMRSFALILAAASGIALAQEQAPPPPTPPPEPQTVPARSEEPRAPRPPADSFGQPVAPQAQPAPLPYGSMPAELTVKPGTWVTVRVSQELSSSRNKVGDPFSAVLTQPIVVDGVVVAQRGQTVFGRVSEAEKSRGGKPSRLGLELTGLSFADGSQESVRSQQIVQQGPRTPGHQQFNTVANTTMLGTIVGDAIDWRSGAAIGAAVGAGVGLATVMVTRNKPTVVYPETVLTFEVQSPVAVSTMRAPGAFRFADARDFEQEEPPRRLERRDRGCRGCGALPIWYPAYGWGTGVAIIWGPYGYYRGGYYRAGWRRW